VRKQQGARIEPTRQTFNPYARAWLERQEVRPRTRQLWVWALERYLIPRLSQRRLRGWDADGRQRTNHADSFHSVR
jgi:hypothetical protein